MKKILVPCDFSEPAIQAFRFASEIAATAKAEVFVLHVVEVPIVHHSMFVPVQSYENAFLRGVKAKAGKNYEKLMAKWGKGIKVSLVVQQGPVLSAIRKFVARKRIDLVVMGTHGSSGFREYSIGSNAEKMVRTSTTPVIAIKKAVPFSGIRDLIFPTNLNGPGKKLQGEIKSLQKLLKAQLHILYVNTPTSFISDKYTEQQMKEFAKRNQFKNCTLHIYNDVGEDSGIVNFSSRFKSKIVVMSTHGRKGIGHLLSGSIAEDVVNHIDCPVWTLAEA